MSALTQQELYELIGTLTANNDRLGRIERKLDAVEAACKDLLTQVTTGQRAFKPPKASHPAPNRRRSPLTPEEKRERDKRQRTRRYYFVEYVPALPPVFDIVTNKRPETFHHTLTARTKDEAVAKMREKLVQERTPAPAPMETVA